MLTQGMFYPGPAKKDALKLNAEAGAIGVEMENATLFCIGQVRGIRTAAIATVDGSPFTWEEEGGYKPGEDEVSRAKQGMIEVGLTVAKKMIE